MAVTENRVAGLQERLKEVMKCEQLNKQQFMKVTDISNIGRKLDGKVAITKVDISKMKHSLLVNDQWLETGIGPMYLPEKLEEKTRERPNTRRSYERTYRCVEAYDGKCSFNTITKDWLEGFIRHEMDKGRKTNGISNDITHIKAVFKKAIDDGKTQNFPFHYIRLKKEETRKRCLSLEQMRELRDAKLHGKQALYRDFFMLGFYLIGINVSDLLTLKKEDFRNGRISYYRNKTGRLYDIKVEPEAMEIISRYRSRKPQYLLRFFEDAGTFDVDHFTNNMNRTLRRIGPKDPKDMRKSSPHPIDSKMSSYYNRHSWATFASEIGISLETIGRALGHSVWEKTVTAIYVKYDNKAVDEANRKVIDYLNG